jgi:hypothetical protein
VQKDNRDRLENLKNELKDELREVPKDEEVIRMYNQSRAHERSFRSGDDADFKVTPELVKQQKAIFDRLTSTPENPNLLSAQSAPKFHDTREGYESSSTN